ncbi:MFS transporter [Candidatus Chlamydia corallus]|uniref:MFS transporter n=1 Tax=Candidatus Chlamydia corallus TaxID=2038470 RepID=UPI000C2FBF07|nr:MFS transporter [Candidatus Chlamydia corallus]
MTVSVQKKSFRALVTTHFLTIINDNLYKFLLAFFLLEGKTLTENAKILSCVSFFFALPFLLLAPLAGSLADRFQKRNIILATRFIEIICTVLGAYFFFIQSVIGGYLVLILMACHTTIFAPAKLGILPEMLPSEQLSQANGIMTAATYTGSILGSCLAPLVVDITHRLDINSYVWPTVLCVVVSIISTIISFYIRPSNVKNVKQKITFASFKDLWKILKDTRIIHYLTVSIFLGSFFLLIGAYTQLEIIPFVEFTLKYPKHYGAYLFPVVALGVGIGSYITGKISGKDIKIGYVPLAAIGLALVFMGLYAFACSVIVVLFFLLALGFLGGVYQVPLHAYVQYASPEHKRGQILAANNFLDFFGVLVAAGVIRVLGSNLGLSPEKSFFYVGWFVLVVSIWTLWIWREHVYRLVLGVVLRKQLGRYLKIHQSSIPKCYFVSVQNYREIRRVLAMLTKTIRSKVIVLDQKLVPGWRTWLLSWCVPTVVSDVKDNDSEAQYAWSVLQANHLKTSLEKFPDICVVCLGLPNNVEKITSILQAQGIEPHLIQFLQKEEKKRVVYTLAFPDADSNS